MSARNWQYLLNNRIFTGHPRANGTRRMTNGRNNILAVKDEVDMVNIEAIPWQQINPDRAQAETIREQLKQAISQANQHLAEGKRLDRTGHDDEARQQYTQSAEIYQRILENLFMLSLSVHRLPILYPIVHAIAPPGTQRACFNYAVRRARETGGEAAAAAVIAASYAASEELSRATDARIPAIQAASEKLSRVTAAYSQLPVTTRNKSLTDAQENLNNAFRKLHGTNYNRNAPLRAAYSTARQFVRAARERYRAPPVSPLRVLGEPAANEGASAMANNFPVNKNDAERPNSPMISELPSLPSFGPPASGAPYVLSLPPGQPRVTLFPFGHPGAGAPPSPLGHTGSLFVSGVAKRGGKKTRRVGKGRKSKSS